MFPICALDAPKTQIFMFEPLSLCILDFSSILHLFVIFVNERDKECDLRLPTQGAGYLLLRPHAEDMKIARPLEKVRRKRLVVGIVRVRRNQRLPAEKSRDDGRMVKIAVGSAQLNDVPDFKIFLFGLLGKRTRAAVARQKFVQILHSRPGSRTVVRVFVEPAHDGRQVHHARTRIDALRGKIGTVSAEAVEIVKSRIACVRPFFCVSDGSLPVILSERHTIMICSFGKVGEPKIVARSDLHPFLRAVFIRSYGVTA